MLCLPGLFCSRESDSVTGPQDPDALNILFVGNSLTYTNDLPGMLQSLVEGADAGPIEVASVAEPNYGLEDHWAVGEAQRRISAGGWDIVVLQQGPSASEGRPSLIEFSEKFAAEAQDHQALVALYMVWPALSRFFDFDGVRDSYRTAAERVNGLFFPAGEAWRLAWDADSTLAFYDSDGYHPTPLATYLAALVIFEQVTNRSPVGLPGSVLTKKGAWVAMDPDVAAVLQNAAQEANRRYALAVPGWPPRE